MLGTLSPLPHIAPEEFEKVFAINVTANFRLIRSMDLLLRQSVAGRAVFVSSGAASHPRAYWGSYAASKAALNAMVKVYADEIGNTPVKANIFYPGQVRTAMRAKAMPGEDPDTLPSPKLIVPALVDMVSPGYGNNGKLFDVKSGELTNL